MPVPSKKSRVHAIDAHANGQGDAALPEDIIDDYHDLPHDRQRVLQQAPSVEMIRTSVIKERPKDIIIHTMKLTYRDWVWYVTVRRTNLRNLYNAMASYEYKAKGKKFKMPSSSPSSKNLKSVRENETSVVERRHLDGEVTSLRSGRGSMFSTSDGDQGSIHNFRRYRKLISRKMYRVDEESIKYQKEVIRDYFASLLNDKLLRNKPELLEALELSPVSFDESLGPSFKEGYLKARCSADTSDRLFKTDADRALCGNFCGEGGGVNCCCCVCFCFRKKATIKRRVRVWAVLKNSSLSLYSSRSCDKLADVILFQPSTVVSDALVSTGSRHGLVIVDTCWMAEIKCDSQVSQKQWVAVVKSAIVQCPWVEKERFTYEPRYSGSLLSHGSMSSFAQWCLTPRDLWENIHDSLLAAKKQVFLAGWWISPEIYLKRPHGKYPEARLDKVIERIAARGVKVYILQFREPKVMPMQSAWTRECFLGLNNGHKNIQYLRHGDITFPYMWSHHEKLVIIDQDLAYVGGVDLCLGRWDSPEYKLRDDGPMDEQLWVGKDYQNPRIKDYVDVHKAFEDNPVVGTGRANIPRMPRRDIHMRVFGQTALDVAWHFVQRWNYTRYVSKAQRHGVDPLAIYGAGAAEMMASDHEKQQSHLHDESGAGSDIHVGGTAGQFTKLIGKSDNTPVIDNTIANVGANSLSEQGRGSSTNEDDVEPEITMYSGRSSMQSGRRPSVIETMKRRLSIAPPALPTNLSQSMALGAGPASGSSPSDFAKPESVSDEEWKSMSTKKRRSSIMGSTIELNGNKVMVSELQSEEGRSVMPFSYEDDNNNQRSRMINGLQKSGMGSKDTNIVSMGNVTEQDAAFLPTLRNPRGPENKRGKRTSFLQKISDKTDKQQRSSHAQAPRTSMRASQNLRAQAPITEEQSENSETESDEGDKDVDYAQLLGEEYRPRSDCTGNPYPVRCTLLRSLGKWSGGLMETEKGIQNAYKHFIESAQHYIYIENQFFVSGMRGNGRVTNTLAQCLYARIMKAAMSKSKFKVLILIPLLPAMEGPVKGGALSSIAGVMYWQYRSICSGGNSLLEELEKSGVDPSKYIKFIGLRTHEKMSTGWQTEMVYIHSKLMIVDDKTTIIGSANMNDRSMVGSKDSEICILTEDTKFEDSSMSDAPYRAGLFSKSLRMKAWGEFCGIKADDKVGLKRIEDPSSDATWNYLDNLALSNTSKYEQVFKDLVPSNRIKKGDDLHGSGTSSGEVKDGDFKRRMSMAGAGVNLDDIQKLVDSQNTKGTARGSARGSALAEMGKGSTKEGKKEGKDSMMQTHSSTHKKKAINLLEAVQGLIVKWPLDFMKEEFKTLHPTALPGEIFK